MNKSKSLEEKEQLSSFYIPIILSKTDLERTLNNQIDGTIFDDKLTEGSLQISVTKVDSIRIEIQDTTIIYRVPLRIYVRKELLVGGIDGEGDIAIDFQTNYKLNSDWSISTQTEITDYGWIKEPKANLLGLKIPVTSIAERVLNSSSEKVTSAIDKQVNESVALKEYALQAWNLLQNPILISEEYDSRFKFTPTGLAISPFKTQKDTIISTLHVQGNTQVGVGQQTNFATNTALLPLHIKDFKRDNNFVMNLVSEIPFAEAEKVAICNFKGEEYGFGKNKIVINDIKLEKDGDVMAIRVETTGDHNGWLLLKGKPVYNKKENHIQIEDIEFSLDTKNFLLKSAKWLLNGLITNKLEGSLVYPLEEDLAMIKDQIENQLTKYNIQEGIFLKGNVKALKVNDAFLKAESIMVGVKIEGAAKILIESLP